MSTILGCEITAELYKGVNSLIYRGIRQTDQQPVILKLLNQAYPSPEKIARFKLEYEITQILNSAMLPAQAGQALLGVIHAYSLGTDQGRWVMVLEDFGGESLDRLIQHRKPALSESLTWAIQMVDILGQVHQQHIIHKDINPSNIVLNPETGQLKLIDFGISTRLSRENPTLRNPKVLEGTLAYMSPEQTGRMNRAIDYRSDFYSLGVTFYEILTGQLPFPTADALELAHCHIAKQPAPPHELNPAIPQPFSEIVLTLLAKNAEDRYQSPYSLKADLETCLQQWQMQGQIDPFPLHRHDISSRFQISQKLYGREQESELLLAAFERVATADGHNSSNGRVTQLEENLPPRHSPAGEIPDAAPGLSPKPKIEMMLVSGYTGIGKSALIQEVYKPITRQRGYFASGKFDQFQRNIPYASLIQAFRLLVRQLLTETEAEISNWREKLLATLGPNGQILIEVIPEVELIIGPQPDVPDLAPLEAQNRFNLVFQNFIKVFTRSEHPLVVFLDDLQWADGASLNLLEVLMTAKDSEYLFLMGAYRVNEVNETHPLLLTAAQIQKAGTPVNNIALSSLTLPHVIQLIADTLYCSTTEARPLAELVLTKTGGNPFFINEFLKSLYAAGLLKFDSQHGKWDWDMEQIQTQNITNNVAELMAGKIQNLAPNTQQVVKLAACIGNQFDLQTLAIVYEKSPQDTAADLWEALSEDLLLPLDDTYKLVSLNVEGLTEAVRAEYKFAHDQIQQAAYALIPSTEKQAVHRRVGQLLLQNTPEAEREYKIFDIVNQLNLGRTFVNQSSEWETLAKLNLMAGQKAKASAAYEPAFNYLQVGLELLAENSWTTHYDLTLALHLEAAQAAYLNSNFDQMGQLVTAVLQQARTLLDKVRIYEVQIQAYVAQNKLLEAIEISLSVLELLGTKLPRKPSRTQIISGFAATKLALLGKRIEDLSNLPIMTDPLKLAEQRILKTVLAVAYLAAPEIFPLIIFRLVNLSLKHGNTADSAFTYALYGLSLGGVMGDIESGYRFGQLALRVREQFNASELKAKVFFTVYFFIHPWKAHLRESIAPVLEGYQAGLESGDVEYASYLIYVPTAFFYHMGQELNQLNQETAIYTEAIAKLKQERTILLHSIRRQIILNLLGHADQPHRIAGPICNEAQLQQLYLETNDRNGLGELHLNKLILNYLFAEYASAVEDAAKVEQYLEALVATIYVPLFHFYDSLARLALLPESTPPEQKHTFKKVAVNQKKMKKWAKYAPANYLHKFYLVEAERARVLGHDQEARKYYDQAIELAHQHEYLNEEALTYELAGKFYLAKGQTRLAGHYLRDAHYAYRRWGAMAKVKDLEARYPQFLIQAQVRSRDLSTKTTDTGETASSTLDLTSVLKASQAISGEIVLDQLLEKLMKIVIENAGAQRGYLILEEEGHWIIAAEGSVAEVKTEAEAKALQAVPLEESKLIPMAVIHYVARTRENVVLNDAAREGIFTQDSYVRQNKSKSILCAPLLNQGKLMGILYLENKLTTGAFTPDRLEVLNMLSAQAAISIENAQLYTRQVALTHAAGRFVPYEFLHLLNKENIVKVNLGDQVQQDMTILVSDIRSFTTMSEMMTPQENFDFVNVYLGHVSPIIGQHHGFIAKYMGDGLMAVFPGRPEDALDAAIAQLRELARYNIDRQQYGEAPIQIGIGIHAGPVMLGTVGEAERMQLDLLSDAVNVTARLEGLTKVYGVPLVISTAVLQRLTEPTRYCLRFLGKTPLKGRQELLSLFEVFDGDPPEVAALKVRTKTAFEEGLSYYHNREWAEAKSSFEQVLQHYPGDNATHFYLEQLAGLSELRLPVQEV